MSFAIDVTGMGPDFDAVAVTIERYTTAPTVDAYGDPQVPAPTLIAATVIAHPATRKQLERAGLDHTQDWRAFYAEVELRTASTGGPPDVIQHEGERWTLIDLAAYGTLGGLWIALGHRIE